MSRTEKKETSLEETFQELEQIIEKMQDREVTLEESFDALDGIIDECSRYSASALVEITHNQTPWIEAYEQGGYNNEITIESIKDYFEEE